jgi:hypothetical protein
MEMLKLCRCHASRPTKRQLDDAPLQEIEAPNAKRLPETQSLPF